MDGSSKRLAWLVAPLLLGCSLPDGQEPELAAGREVDVPEVVTEEALSAWNVRLEEAELEPTGFQLVQEDGALAVRTGPAGIAWRAIDLVPGGDYSVGVTFEPRDTALDRSASFGLVLGGRNLSAVDRTYTYFLVRPTGEYMIGRRDGDDTRVLVDWAAGPDTPAAESGRRSFPARSLTVEVDGEQVRFLVDDQRVATLGASVVRPHGVTGLRVGSRLALGVRDWNVTAEDASPAPERGVPGSGSGG